jgi:hypothetical protein
MTLNPTEFISNRNHLEKRTVGKYRVGVNINRIFRIKINEKQ